MIDVTALIDEAFLPMEKSLAQVETQLSLAKQIMQEAKQQSIAAMSAVEAAAIAQAEGAAEAVAAAEKAASRTALAEMYVAAQEENTKDSLVLSDTELSRMSFEDVDYETSEMAPPFLSDDQCLLPGEPTVRVEKAPENSRRIFAGIDIPHSVNEVWALLTDYEHLSDVVPNLVVNEVLEQYNTDFCKDTTVTYVDSNLPEEVQCRDLANQMKGALLRQGEFKTSVLIILTHLYFTCVISFNLNFFSFFFVLFVLNSRRRQGGRDQILGSNDVGSARIPVRLARLRSLQRRVLGRQIPKGACQGIHANSADALSLSATLCRVGFAPPRHFHAISRGR